MQYNLSSFIELMYYCCRLIQKEIDTEWNAILV
jgi:hypothetical protein